MTVAMHRWGVAVLLMGVLLIIAVVSGQEQDPYADYHYAEATTDCGCKDEVKPVCSYDGTSYKNSCEAQCADAVVVHNGKCASSPAPAPLPGAQPVPACKRPCPPDQLIVCGNDQRTYANPCGAACNRARTYTVGPCPPIRVLAAQQVPSPSPAPVPPSVPDENIQCPPNFDTKKYRTTSYTDGIETTTKISPKRANANVGQGAWIPGRATYYGTDPRIEKSRVKCGEPAGQYGILAYGNCGYTDGDGKTSYPEDMYAAAADTNADYPGACGRCYQIRCRTGSPENNGRPIRISDLQYYKPYFMKDNQGRDYPGNPYETQDLFWTKCWDENQVITVRIGDACPCQYYIKFTGETRTQPWCCGGNNHFDLSVWAFQKLAHPSYGVMKMEYRPVNCESGQPLRSVPGFVNMTIYDDGIGAGWTWRPYFAKNQVLLGSGQGLSGGKATCATLSKNGAMSFVCQHCTKTGYQPFGKAAYLRFWIRSNSPSADPYASSTPKGQVPPLKIFMMNEEKSLYCGADVILGQQKPVQQAGEWYKFKIPLTSWKCKDGSAGNRANVNRIDFQNVQVRDANICLDQIALV